MSRFLRLTADRSRAEIASLELQVAEREAELVAAKTELQVLQSRYLEEIGPLYAELIPLDAAVAAAEIEAGLRAPDDPETTEAEDPRFRDDRDGSPGCGPASTPAPDLKRMFRDIARAVHPDVAHPEVDERTRYRRHSLMAEANRAYAERDEDRLRLILRAWELDPESGFAAGPDEERARVQRRASVLAARLVEIEAEFADLRRSAIARLKAKIDDARQQGWDLFAEMRRQVEREILMGRATLAKLRRKNHLTRT